MQVNDDDMIRRGDARALCGLINANADAFAVDAAIDALPAVTVNLRPLIWRENSPKCETRVLRTYCPTIQKWCMIFLDECKDVEAEKRAFEIERETRIRAALVISAVGGL